MKVTRNYVLNLLAVAFGVTLGLIGLELTLRTASWLILYAQEWSNPKPDLLSQKEFRIVTLGESTTAQFWSDGRETSWPGQLEKYLNEAGLGRKFKVINLAKVGTSSPFQTAELIREAGHLRPHAVISMMGINDWVPYEYLNAPGAGSLRTVKLAKWVRQSLSFHLGVAAEKKIRGIDLARISSALELQLRGLETISAGDVRSAVAKVYAFAAATGANDGMFCAGPVGVFLKRDAGFRKNPEEGKIRPGMRGICGV